MSDHIMCSLTKYRCGSGLTSPPCSRGATAWSCTVATWRLSAVGGSAPRTRPSAWSLCRGPGPGSSCWGVRRSVSQWTVATTWGMRGGMAANPALLIWRAIGGGAIKQVLLSIILGVCWMLHHQRRIIHFCRKNI